MFKRIKTSKPQSSEKLPLWTSLSETEQEIAKGGYPPPPPPPGGGSGGG